MNRKEALLRAAKELFGECGYSETTFKKISDRAGVALGLLSHHFGNKEKLFLASGLDVLAKFQAFLEQAVAEAANGYDGVIRFCRAYLDFTRDPDSYWLVLVRCSPYSDMKTHADRQQMESRFRAIHQLLAQQLRQGVADGSLIQLDVETVTQVVISTLVGANRTVVLTPYASENMFEETIAFISRALKAGDE